MNIRHPLLKSAGLIALATACGKAPEGAPRTEGGDPASAITVQAAQVRASSAGAVIEIPGTIESSRKALISSRMTASISSFSHREGDLVSAGAVLVQLDGEALAAGLAAAEASDLASARDLARAQALLAKGAATRVEVENAGTAAARTRSAVIAAQDALSHATIRAPFAGRIVRKIANAGDSVGPGTPVLEIEGDGGLEVAAAIEASLRDRLKVGQKLDIRIDGVPGSVQGVVRTLEPSADPSTHRFTVRISLRGAVGIRAGLFARIQVPASETERRILVPTEAVLRRGGLTGVYVIRDGHAWLRWIAPGETYGDALEARAGLDEGERVALDPSRLHDGALISEGR